MNLLPKKISLLLLLTITTQTSCVPALLVGGAGSMAYTASQDRSVGETIDDAAIEAQINAKFAAQKYNGDFNHISIDSVQGRVLLTGTAPSREVKITAYNLAWEVEHVKEVVNEVKVDSNVRFSARQYASDVWISTQIESKLLFTKGIKTQNYSVETIDGVVYLMGIAQDRSELDAVTAIASEINGVQKVVSYVKIGNSSSGTNNYNNNANRNTISVEEEQIQTVPGSSSAGENYRAPVTNSLPTGDGSLIIEESPNAQ